MIDAADPVVSFFALSWIELNMTCWRMTEKGFQRLKTLSMAEENKYTTNMRQWPTRGVDGSSSLWFDDHMALLPSSY